MKKVIIIFNLILTSLVCSAQVISYTEGEDPLVEFNEHTGEFLLEMDLFMDKYSQTATICESDIVYINNMISIKNDGREITLTYSDSCKWVSQMAIYNDMGMISQIFDFHVPITLD